MKIWILVLELCIISTLIINCGGPATQPQNKQGVPPPAISRAIDHDEAVNIAKAEALKEGKSLERYDIKAVEETKGWSVEFQLKDLTMGGGLTYVIDKQTGRILARRESQ